MKEFKINKETRSLLNKIASNVATRHDKNLDDSFGLNKLEEYFGLVNDLILTDTRFKTGVVLLNNIINITIFIPGLNKVVLMVDEPDFPKLTFMNIGDWVYGLLEEMIDINVKFTSGIDVNDVQIIN